MIGIQNKKFAKTVLLIAFNLLLSQNDLTIGIDSIL